MFLLFMSFVLPSEEAEEKTLFLLRSLNSCKTGDIVVESD